MNKKIELVLSVVLACLMASCSDEYEVRVMPDFNYVDNNIELYKNAGSEHTALLLSTVGEVTAEYDCPWLSVDVDTRRAIYTATQDNETGEPRATTVYLHSGDITKTVTVTQSDLLEGESHNLKIGQLTDDGLGMIFWVDPADPQSGKAVTLQRWPGSPYEASPKLHNAFSTVNGQANTDLYADGVATDAPLIAKGVGEGWYLPASQELVDLFNAYNGVAVTDPSFKSVVPSSLTGEETLARSTFDKMLTDLGGTPMNEAAATSNGESYWSSTETSDGQSANYVRFGKYTLSTGKKSSTSVRYVRAMKIVGNYSFPEDPATLKLSASNVSLKASANAADTIAITSNSDQIAAQVEEADWLKATVEGKNLIISATSANTSTSARTAKVNVTAGHDANIATATVNVSQEGKSNDGYKVGQMVDGGIVYKVDATDPTKATIVSLKRSYLAWNDITAPEGWRLPSKDEMVEIFKLYDGTDDVTVDFPKSITDAEKAARAAFDKMFTDNGGDAWNTAASDKGGDSYWTSTEDSGNSARALYVRFGKYLVSQAVKTGQRYVRFIKDIQQ